MLLGRSSERAVLRRDWLTARAPPRPPVRSYLLTSRRRRRGVAAAEDNINARAHAHAHASVLPLGKRGTGGAAHCVFKKHRDIRCALINCLCPVQEGAGGSRREEVLLLKSEQPSPLTHPHPSSSSCCSYLSALAAERPTLAAIFTQGRSQSCRESAEQAEPVTWAEPAAASRWRRRTSRSRSRRKRRSRRRTRKLVHRHKKKGEKMVRRKSLDENEPECGKGIPFPIQTFLWRQTRSVSVSENRCLSSSGRQQPFGGGAGGSPGKT